MAYFKTQSERLANTVQASGAQAVVELDNKRAYSQIRYYAHLSDTPTATLQIEISPDYDPSNPSAATWFEALAADITAAGSETKATGIITGPVTAIRANVKAYTAGDIDVWIEGLRNP